MSTDTNPDLIMCGTCGDEFTQHDRGTCGNCMAGETAALHVEIERLTAERDALRAELAALRAQEPVAWDVYERRIYGAPGEKRHRVLWFEQYRHSDGVVRELDGLLESARERGIDNGARTIHVRPLYSAPIVSAPAAQIEEIASEIESAIQTMPGKLLANLIREGVTALKSHIVYAMAPMPPQGPVSDEEIREVFLANGFTLKPGHIDLKPYVFSAARALLALRPAREPLTVERCRHLCAQVDAQQEATAGDYAVDFVRAIERAHGITE